MSRLSFFRDVLWCVSAAALIVSLFCGWMVGEMSPLNASLGVLTGLLLGCSVGLRVEVR